MVAEVRHSARLQVAEMRHSAPCSLRLAIYIEALVLACMVVEVRHNARLQVAEVRTVLRAASLCHGSSSWLLLVEILHPLLLLTFGYKRFRLPTSY